MALADLVAAAERSYQSGAVKPIESHHLFRTCHDTVWGCVMGAAYVEKFGRGPIANGSHVPTITAIERLCRGAYGVNDQHCEGLQRGFDGLPLRPHTVTNEADYAAAHEAGAALRRKWLTKEGG